MASKRRRKRLPKEDIVKIVNNILDDFGRVEPRMLAARAFVSRQTAHAHLASMLRAGQLRREGRGRATHYVRARSLANATADVRTLRFPLKGLEEDRAYEQVERVFPVELSENAQRIVRFAMTELINNAIDHSGGRHVTVRLSAPQRQLRFEIEDDGEGLFQHAARLLERSPLDIAQDLSKGKLSTDPARHTGQGIFFTSRSLDRFAIESDSLRLSFDNLRQDVALGQIKSRPGTLVWGELNPRTKRQLKKVFDEYSNEDYAFTRTKTWIKLFRTGLHFVSRSEAKRLVAGLEKFEEVVLDFRDVDEVGQGFTDELFRVWAKSHPQTRLSPVNMVRPVEAMIRRALGAQ